MTREEIYRNMEENKIIMYDDFVDKLDKTPLAELKARWLGILELDKEHQIQTQRADWLAMFMWNSSALTVGNAELARLAKIQKLAQQRKEEAEQQRREEKIRQTLARQKIAFWNVCSIHDRENMVKTYLTQCDGFAREFIKDELLEKLDSIPDRTVLMWFWNIIPPFSIRDNVA